MSQSLFYWNPFCNSSRISDINNLFLCRNPYFIGILSAIQSLNDIDELEFESQSLFYWNPFCNIIKMFETKRKHKSQSLFYWNPFCNGNYEEYPECGSKCRNPYFIGILSAIRWRWKIFRGFRKVAILILLESFLQSVGDERYLEGLEKSQSLFYWNPFCNRAWYTYLIWSKTVAILILLESFLQYYSI